MQQEIAVILDKDLQLTRLQDASILLVYKRENMGWIVRKEIPVNNIFAGTLPAIRHNLIKLQAELSDCKIIIGTNITGVVFNVFNQAGFIISELQSFHESMLESIYEQINNELMGMKKERERSNTIPTKPYETDRKDFYFFDFSLLKNSNAPHSSKSTMIPFLNSTPFKQLEIICDHVMPWLDFEMQKRGFTYETAKTETGKYRIIIKPANI